MSSTTSTSTAEPATNSINAEDEEIQFISTNLDNHYFQTSVSEKLYNFRILQLKDSLFIYIGENDNEDFDEMAMAMPMTEPTTPTNSSSISKNNILGTTIFGPQLGYGSQDLAKQIAKRLNKQIFFSCNVMSDQMTKLALIKRLIEEIDNVPEKF